MIHETALVQSQHIGTGTRIWQFVVILPAAVIGEHCNICSHCFIENEVRVGNQVTIKSGVQLWDGVTLEDRVFVGPNVTFTNDLYPRSQQYAEEWSKTLVQQGASIGANTTLISGITIGRFAMIGAGSVVTKDIPAYTLWYGNPAQHRGYVTEEGTILNLSLQAADSTAQYELLDGKPVLKSD